MMVNALTMRKILLLTLCLCATSAYSEEKSLRFGAQLSGNSYKLADPDGPTEKGKGAAFGLFAAYDTGRNARYLFNVTRDSYDVNASVNNIGQDVTTTEGTLSYQAQWRLSRSIKPWFGAGLGYASSDFHNRYRSASAGSPFGVYLANRKSNDGLVVLNINNEFGLEQDFDIGIQAQVGKLFSDNAYNVRLGVYVIY